MKPAMRIKPRRRDLALFDTVLGDRRPQHARFLVHAAAWLLAIGGHVSLLVMAYRAEPSLELWGAEMAVLIHEELAAQAPIAIEAAQAPEPEPPPELADPELAPTPAQDPGRRPAPSAPSRRVGQARQGQSAPAAEAGEIVATGAAKPGPVDFTDNTFVTGQASAYVGGVSASDGANQVPVPEQAVDRAAKRTGKPGRSSQARPVQLSGNEWRCDWPYAAVAQGIYEQSLVLRVLVRSDGTVERVTVVNDPGRGFGSAAIACARRTRFMPALNADGEPIRAMSPPIRVRFTR